MTGGHMMRRLYRITRKITTTTTTVPGRMNHSQHVSRMQCQFVPWVEDWYKSPVDDSDSNDSDGPVLYRYATQWELSSNFQDSDSPRCLTTGASERCLLRRWILWKARVTWTLVPFCQRFPVLFYFFASFGSPPLRPPPTVHGRTVVSTTVLIRPYVGHNLTKFTNGHLYYSTEWCNPATFGNHFRILILYSISHCSWLCHLCFGVPLELLPFPSSSSAEPHIMVLC